MDIIIFHLSTFVMFLAGLVLYTRHTAIKTFIIICYPVIINAVDVLISGNHTTFRQWFYALYAFILYLVLYKQNDK